MSRNGCRKAVTATLAVLSVSVAALLGAPGALGDTSCPSPSPDGWVCGATEPPIPPDQAGNPLPITIEADQIPDVPPSVTVDLGLQAHPKKKKRK